MTQAQTDTAETGAKVPFKHPSESYTEQVHIVTQSDINGFDRLFGGAAHVLDRHPCRGCREASLRAQCHHRLRGRAGVPRSRPRQRHHRHVGQDNIRRQDFHGGVRQDLCRKPFGGAQHHQQGVCHARRARRKRQPRPRARRSTRNRPRGGGMESGSEAQGAAQNTPHRKVLRR